MARRVWPFKPISPVLDIQSWFTDVFRAKSSEQRIRLRASPARILQYSYLLDDYDLSYAQALLRANQGADGFYVPDWTQADAVGGLTSGSGVVVPVDISDRVYSDEALVWQSPAENERVAVAADSNGLTIDTLVNSYTNATVLPLWYGDAPEGIEADKLGAWRNSLAIGFVLDGAEPYGGSSYTQYRGLDVVPDCPVLAGGLGVGYTQELSSFGNGVGNTEYIRQRDLAEVTFELRWKKFTSEEHAVLRDWVATRYGRLCAFWVTSSSKDLEPAAEINGTTVTVFNDVIVRDPVYHLEILVNDGTRYYRQVTASASGTEINGRETADLTIDGSITSLSVASIKRISYLYCARFDSDRVEYEFTAPGILTLVMPCREVPEP